ncbi:hypothetical protein [Sphingobium aquiterrae]
MNAEEERKARLAQALRDNLRRRKAQAREEQATRGQDIPAPDSRDDTPPA